MLGLLVLAAAEVGNWACLQASWYLRKCIHLPLCASVWPSSAPVCSSYKLPSNKPSRRLMPAAPFQPSACT